jgi:hypothetical protein
MKYFSLLFLAFVLFTCLSCNKEKPPTKEVFLPQEALDFFVDADPGTKWIYEDTLQHGRYDTIELISKNHYDVDDGGGTITRGFELYYKPRKTKDFKLIVQPSLDRDIYMRIDPLALAGGGVLAEKVNNVWLGNSFKDSIKIRNRVYYQVLDLKGTSSSLSLIIYAKNIGLISYVSEGISRNIPGGIYVFSSKIK